MSNKKSDMGKPKSVLMGVIGFIILVLADQWTKKMAVLRDGGRSAVTHYTPVRALAGHTLCRMQLETGRTHQIRVHMAYIGHPVLGDPVYGGVQTPFEKKHPALFHGQCLHAAELSFVHPTTGKEVTFRCDPPENFVRIVKLLKQE